MAAVAAVVAVVALAGLGPADAGADVPASPSGMPVPPTLPPVEVGEQVPEPEVDPTTPSPLTTSPTTTTQPPSTNPRIAPGPTTAPSPATATNGPASSPRRAPRRQPTRQADVPVEATLVEPAVADSPAEPAIARLREMTLPAARQFGFPLGLAVLVLAFLAVQSRLDARDPKLAAAPLTVDDDLLPFA